MCFDGLCTPCPFLMVVWVSTISWIALVCHLGLPKQPPKKETQTSIVMTLKNKFGDRNIVGFNFGGNVNHVEDKQFE